MFANMNEHKEVSYFAITVLCRDASWHRLNQAVHSFSCPRKQSYHQCAVIRGCDLYLFVWLKTATRYLCVHCGQLHMLPVCIVATVARWSYLTNQTGHRDTECFEGEGEWWGISLPGRLGGLGEHRSSLSNKVADFYALFSEKPPLVNYQMLINAVSLSYLSDVKMNTG